MHGRIFVIDTEKDFQKRGELYSPIWEPHEMVNFIPGCDYVTESEDFEEDVRWFTEVFRLDRRNIRSKKVLSLDEERYVYEVDIEPLVESLAEEKRRRIRKIREELEKDPDMWKIHWIAWADSTFWFVLPGNSFEPEMGLLEELLGFKKRRIEKIWFVDETYDYDM